MAKDTASKKEFSFGACSFEKTSPRLEALSPSTKILNIAISFEEALYSAQRTCTGRERINDNQCKWVTGFL